MNELISVIVPIYNAQKYLRKCIESITKQTYTNIEIILVDDGSTDNSLSICKEYENIDNRITIISKENQGVSSARNEGIAVASGEYVMFVDSDDFIEFDTLDSMYKKFDDEVDLVVASIKMVSKDRIERYCMENRTYTAKSLLEDYCFDKFPRICISGPVCKLYRVNTIKSNKIMFNLSMDMGEDTFFNMDYLIHCRNIVSMSKIVYNYIRDNVNSLYSRFNKDRYRQSELVLKKVIKSSEVLQCDAEAIDDFSKKYACGYISTLGSAVMVADKETCISLMEEISDNEILRQNVGMLKNKYRNYLLAKMVLKKHYLLVYYISKIGYELKSKITKIKNGEL